MKRIKRIGTGSRIGFIAGEFSNLVLPDPSPDSRKGLFVQERHAVGLERIVQVDRDCADRFPIFFEHDDGKRFIALVYTLPKIHSATVVIIDFHSL